MEMEELLKWLEARRQEAKTFFPDNDAKNAGYIWALDDVIDKVKCLMPGVSEIKWFKMPSHLSNTATWGSLCGDWQYVMTYEPDLRYSRFYVSAKRYPDGPLIGLGNYATKDEAILACEIHWRGIQQ